MHIRNLNQKLLKPTKCRENRASLSKTTVYFPSHPNRNLKIFILIKKNSSLYPGPLIKLKSGIFRKNFSPGSGSRWENSFYLSKNSRVVSCTRSRSQVFWDRLQGFTVYIELKLELELHLEQVVIVVTRCRDRFKKRLLVPGSISKFYFFK